MSRLEAAELVEAIGGSATVERSEQASEFGDVTLVAVVAIVSAATLKTMGLWLAKERSRSVARQEVEVRRPDGSSYRQIIELRTSSEGGLDESVVRALGDIAAADQPSLGEGTVDA